MNSFAIAKSRNLETNNDQKNSLYILEQPGASLSDDVIDKVIKFDVGKSTIL